MKKLTFSQVRQLKADLLDLEKLAQKCAEYGYKENEKLITEQINGIKSLLSLHYGKDQSSY